jgi:hypothetical protein
MVEILKNNLKTPQENKYVMAGLLLGELMQNTCYNQCCGSASL